MHQVSAFVTALSAVSYTAPRGARWDSPGVGIDVPGLLLTIMLYLKNIQNQAKARLGS